MNQSDKEFLESRLWSALADIHNEVEKRLITIQYNAYNAGYERGCDDLKEAKILLEEALKAMNLYLDFAEDARCVAKQQMERVSLMIEKFMEEV